MGPERPTSEKSKRQFVYFVPFQDGVMYEPAYDLFELGKAVLCIDPYDPEWKVGVQFVQENRV